MAVGQNSSLGVYGGTLPHVYNVNFNNCQFLAKVDEGSKPLIELATNVSKPSLFKFNNCAIYYAYLKSGATTMPKHCFIYSQTQVIKFVEFYNCKFYFSLPRHSESNVYGFVSKTVGDAIVEIYIKNENGEDILVQYTVNSVMPINLFDPYPSTD